MASIHDTGDETQLSLCNGVGESPGNLVIPVIVMTTSRRHSWKILRIKVTHIGGRGTIPPPALTSEMSLCDGERIIRTLVASRRMEMAR